MESSYIEAQRALVCKAIEELSFEEVLIPVEAGDRFFLNTANSHCYSFQADYGAWGNLQIDKNSLSYKDQEGKSLAIRIQDFFMDFQDECGMSDDTLVKYMEEANNTIYSDLKVQENLKQQDFRSLIKKEFNDIDRLLSGHPKLIMNKGRVGWSESDIQSFAPEFDQSFQLIWLSVENSILKSGKSDFLDYQDLLLDCIPEDIVNQSSAEGRTIVPVHPWQWNRYLKIQFSQYLLDDKIRYLGEFGEFFKAQASIRTLSNQNKKSSFDIKLSLSILNTSCVRGISSKFIEKGHYISSFMNELIDGDEYLKEKLQVLSEKAAFHIPHPQFSKLEQASYRYHELFGCVWRESVSSKLKEGQKAIPVASLLLENDSSTFFSGLIETSNASIESWLSMYFEKVIMPLYYLQHKHGLGLVAHGQNVILVLKNSLPDSLTIKDFHGDLRISDSSIHIAEERLQVLDVLPKEHLIHDLITGHFISFLRYFSRVLKFRHAFLEEDFYGILYQKLKDHQKQFGVEADSTNLLMDRFHKILVNRVRFVKGYEETPVRLKPLLGNYIKNPFLPNSGVSHAHQ